MLKVVLGNTKSQHIVEKLQSDGYEDGQLCRRSCWTRSSLSTQRTDFGLMAVKMDDYA